MTLYSLISDIAAVIVLGRLVRLRAGEYRRRIGVMKSGNGVFVVLGNIAYARASQIEL